MIGESRNVTEFNYRFNDKEDFLAHVYLAFEISDTAEVKPLMDGLEAKNFGCIDLTENEAAKLHIRHLVGGRVRDNGDGVKERILRFEFPEVPGASINFL